MERIQENKSEKTQILYFLAFAVILASFVLYSNNPLDEKALIFSNLGVLSFITVLGIAGRIEVFNKYLLLIDFVFAIYAFFFIKYIVSTSYSKEYLIIAVLNVAEQWMILMILCNIALKLRRGLRFSFEISFAFLIIVAILLLFNRNGRIMPITLFLFVLICILDIDMKEWMKIIGSIVKVGNISFIVISLLLIIDLLFLHSGIISLCNICRVYCYFTALFLFQLIQRKRQKKVFSIFLIGCIAVSICLILIVTIRMIIPPIEYFQAIKYFVGKSLWGGTSIDSLREDYGLLEAIHNQYINLIYEYGILSGSLYICFAIYCVVKAINKYKKVSDTEYLFPIVLGIAMLTSWMFVTAGLYSILDFIFLLSLYPILIKQEERRDC